MPIPWLSRKSPLSSEQKQFWDENGYLILEGFFTPGVNSIVDHRIANPGSFGKATIDVLHGDHILASGFEPPKLPGKRLAAPSR